MCDFSQQVHCNIFCPWWKKCSDKFENWLLYDKYSRLINTNCIAQNGASFVVCYIHSNLRTLNQQMELFWGRDKMAAITQTTLSNAFSWMKMLEFRLKFQLVPKGPLNNIAALVHIMAWRRPGDKPLSEPMMTLFNDAYMRHSASMS